jgi:thiamine-monophosphate kinase
MSKQRPNTVRLSDRGERWAVEKIQKLLGDRGIGDDCAYTSWGPDYLLSTTDAITITTHLPWPSPRAWGWHVAAVNLSDIASKGGAPIGLLLSLLIPNDTEAKVVMDIMRGAKECCARFGTKVLGGDTKQGPEICLVGTALGRVPKKEFMPRGGARPGDVIALTGELGGAAADFIAIRMLKALGNTDGADAPGKAAGRGADAPGREAAAKALVRRISGRLLRPVPRIPEGRAAARTRLVHASTDLSDGFSASIHQLCRPSGVGADIIWDELPICKGLLRHGNASEDWALHFGGEYELMMAFPLDAMQKVRRAVEMTGTRLTVVGRVVKGNRVMLVRGKERKPLRYGGWEHFIREETAAKRHRK